MQGLGAIWEGASMLQPQLDWLGKVWGIVDAKGRSWAKALSDAAARAEAGDWPANDALARSDLLALIVSSAFHARAVSSMPDIGGRASDALNRTWVIFARDLGVDPAVVKSSDIRAKMQQQNASQANLALFDLLLLIAATAAVAIVYVVAFYLVAQIINNLLSRVFTERELIRKHVEWEKIVDKHLQDGTPFTDDEKEVLRSLEGAQAKLGEQLSPPLPGGMKEASFWDSPWAWAGLATVVGGTVLAIVYREEIKRLLEPPRRLKSA